MDHDKIKGLLYGQLIGDALGVSTEFMTKDEVSKIYKNRIIYENIIDDNHRSNWKKGEWTDDSDMFFVTLKYIIDETDNCIIDGQIFAKKIFEWYKNGLEIDKNYIKPPNGIGRTIRRVINHPLFLKNYNIASLMYSQSKSNGAIMRISCLALFPNCKENTITSCKVTHMSNDCIISCLFLTLILKQILNLTNKINIRDLDNIINIVLNKIKKLNYDISVLEKFININSLHALKLNNQIGYTYKPLGCAIFALKKHIRYKTSFYDIIEEIIREGGDSDTNCAVAASLLGCYVGYNQIEFFLKNDIQHVDFILKIFNKISYKINIMEGKKSVPEFGYGSSTILVLNKMDIDSHNEYIEKNKKVNLIYDYTFSSSDFRKDESKIDELDTLIRHAPNLTTNYTLYSMVNPDYIVYDISDKKLNYHDLEKNMVFSIKQIISTTYDKSYPLNPFNKNLSLIYNNDDEISELKFFIQNNISVDDLKLF